MASPVHGGLLPTENSDHLTTQPNGSTEPGTSPAARPDAPRCPPPETSDQTKWPRLTKADRWIEAKKRGVYRGRTPSLDAARAAELREKAAAGVPKAFARHFGISLETVYAYLRTEV